MTSMSNQQKSLIEASLDTNDTATVTSAVEMDLARHIFLAVNGTSGTHATHVVKIQESYDGSAWFEHASISVTGTGTSSGTSDARFVRAKVTTAEGGASVSTIAIQAKA